MDWDEFLDKAVRITREYGSDLGKVLRSFRELLREAGETEENVSRFLKFYEKEAKHQMVIRCN